MALKQFAPPVLPLPPTNEYNSQYFSQLVRVLNIYFNQAGSTTPVVFDSITLTNLPTSSAGLPSGAVWNDSNTLKIVP
jgi:hypothetical protein